ncbi:MAG: hypothetical protein WCZ86_06070 [Desulfurivibrionaceae bacterium]
MNPTITITIEAFGEKVVKTEDAALALAYIRSMGVSTEDPKLALETVYSEVARPLFVKGQEVIHAEEKRVLEAKFSTGG